MVSKTIVEGSIPSIPAKRTKKSQTLICLRFFLCSIFEFEVYAQMSFVQVPQDNKYLCNGADNEHKPKGGSVQHQKYRRYY